MDINALFDEVYPSLFRYCHRLTGDADLAEDVAQEAFVRLWKKRIRGPDHGRKAWIFRVATNLIRDTARQEANRGRILAGSIPREPVPGPDREVERGEEIVGVRTALDKISPRDREILLLRQEGLSYKEVAEALDVAPTSVGALLARALRRFAAVYEKENQRNGTSG